jgi:hypothetical protein
MPAARSPNFEVDHNVYILGAGFSVDAGMPTLATFLSRMRESAAWLERAGQARELEAVKTVLAFRRRAAGAAYRVNVNVDNIEELFSLASAGPGDELSDAVPLAICATLQFCEATHERKDRFIAGWRDPGALEGWILPAAWKRATAEVRTVAEFRYHLSAHDWYAGVISGRLTKNSPHARNTVITFNYDTQLETALSSFGDVAFRYGLEDDGNVNNNGAVVETPLVELPILKLHGSMNWATDKGGSTVVITSSYNELRSRHDLRPLIVPPTWQKLFTGHLRRVWQLAVSALETATRVIIVGFSVPPTDTHFKYLLAAGLQENISLRQVHFVNPDNADPVTRLLSVLRTSSTDSDLIIAVRKQAQGFFFDPSELQRIGRPPSETGVPPKQQ